MSDSYPLSLDLCQAFHLLLQGLSVQRGVLRIRIKMRLSCKVHEHRLHPAIAMTAQPRHQIRSAPALEVQLRMSWGQAHGGNSPLTRSPMRIWIAANRLSVTFVRRAMLMRSHFVITSRASTKAGATRVTSPIARSAWLTRRT
jgi:hypothetical protein